MATFLILGTYTNKGAKGLVEKKFRSARSYENISR